MKGLKICCLTGCAIFLICCSAVWASSTTGENRAAGLKDTHGKTDIVCICYILCTFTVLQHVSLMNYILAASHTLSTQLKPRKGTVTVSNFNCTNQSKFIIPWCILLITDVTSFQTSRRKRAEVGDVLTAAAIGTAVGGPIGGLIGAALCVAFCKGKRHLQV